jgi:hypothetical protein
MLVVVESYSWSLGETVCSTDLIGDILDRRFSSLTPLASRRDNGRMKGLYA